MSDEQAEPIDFRTALADAVAAFEAKFTTIDDHYLHQGQTKTAEGEPFQLCCAGANVRAENVTYIAMQDHVAAVAEWVRVAETFDTTGHDYLAWRVRPHFQAFEGGFILTSSFASGRIADRSDATKERLQPAAP